MMTSYKVGGGGASLAKEIASRVMINFKTLQITFMLSILKDYCTDSFINLFHSTSVLL